MQQQPAVPPLASVEIAGVTLAALVERLLLLDSSSSLSSTTQLEGVLFGTTLEHQEMRVSDSHSGQAHRTLTAAVHSFQTTTPWPLLMQQRSSDCDDTSSCTSCTDGGGGFYDGSGSVLADRLPQPPAGQRVLGWFVGRRHGVPLRASLREQAVTHSMASACMDAGLQTCASPSPPPLLALFGSGSAPADGRCATPTVGWRFLRPGAAGASAPLDPVEVHVSNLVLSSAAEYSNLRPVFSAAAGAHLLSGLVQPSALEPDVARVLDQLQRKAAAAHEASRRVQQLHDDTRPMREELGGPPDKV
eukprot:TRINITY_DN8852_c0_g1_i1.p1 TRINITY_DN8852_c0_g1~~TRINITY_DN8852_c0_g1_i1.p1  ORF type:complete len:303 (+),score=125.37 TRINITY_DN8852_c0_g1_i1:200-1108(+)